MGRTRGAAAIERDARLIAHIKSHPEQSYYDIAKEFGISYSWVSVIASRNGICRQECNGITYGHAPSQVGMAKPGATMNYAERKAAPKCALCKILFAQITEGIARARDGETREVKVVCQSCAEEYGYDVIEWLRAPEYTLEMARHSRLVLVA